MEKLRSHVTDEHPEAGRSPEVREGLRLSFTRRLVRHDRRAARGDAASGYAGSNYADDHLEWLDEAIAALSPEYQIGHQPGPGPTSHVRENRLGRGDPRPCRRPCGGEQSRGTEGLLRPPIAPGHVIHVR